MRSDDSSTQLNRCSSQADATSGHVAEQLPTTEVGVSGGGQTEEAMPSCMAGHGEVGAKATEDSMADPSVVRGAEVEVQVRGQDAAQQI